MLDEILLVVHTYVIIKLHTYTYVRIYVCIYVVYMIMYGLHMYVDIDSLVVSKEEFEKYNHVGKAFIVLQTKMRALLKNADCVDLRNACIAQIQNPGGADLSQELVDKIAITENNDDLFKLLIRTPYWNWIDIRILEMMVVASNSSQALQLLENYKAAVFSKRLIDLLPNVPSKEVKQKYHAKVVTKINKDHNEITVADLLEFQSQLEAVIMDIKKGVCILEHLEQGCVEAHWYIPRNCVDGAYQNAKLKCFHFNDLHLQYLKIGCYPVIHNPLVSPDTVAQVPSPPVNIG